jgi:hypothetical protein
MIRYWTVEIRPLDIRIGGAYDAKRHAIYINVPFIVVSLFLAYHGAEF